MDLDFYRRRESEERMSADRTLDLSRKTAHLELADRYRAVIEAFENVAINQRPLPGGV